MGETFEQLLAAIVAKAEAAADALNYESQLEDDRAEVKAQAIERICIRDNLKATPAEKIVETDEGYAAHRAKQRASIIARFRADAEYKAAELRAVRAANPQVEALERENVNLCNEITRILRQRDELAQQVGDLSIELGQAKRERDEARDAAADEIRIAEERLV
jgi:hypothetical protein